MSTMKKSKQHKVIENDEGAIVNSVVRDDLSEKMMYEERME